MVAHQPSEQTGTSENAPDTYIIAKSGAEDSFKSLPPNAAFDQGPEMTASTQTFKQSDAEPRITEGNTDSTAETTYNNVQDEAHQDTDTAKFTFTDRPTSTPSKSPTETSNAETPAANSPPLDAVSSQENSKEGQASPVHGNDGSSEAHSDSSNRENSLTNRSDHLSFTSTSGGPSDANAGVVAPDLDVIEDSETGYTYTNDNISALYPSIDILRDGSQETMEITDREGVSTSSVVGISVGCAVGMVIVAALYVFRKRFHRTINDDAVVGTDEELGTDMNHRQLSSSKRITFEATNEFTKVLSAHRISMPFHRAKVNGNDAHLSDYRETAHSIDLSSAYGSHTSSDDVEKNVLSGSKDRHTIDLNDKRWGNSFVDALLASYHSSEVLQVDTISSIHSSSEGERVSSSALLDKHEILDARIAFEEVAMNKFTMKGNATDVYCGNYRGQEVAIKKLSLESSMRLSTLNKFLAQVEVATCVFHDRIVPFVGIAWTSFSDLRVVHEYMQGGDLKSVLNANKDGVARKEGFNFQEMHIAVQILEAMVFLHSFDPPIVHGRLKTQKVLLDERMDARLNAFGSTQDVMDFDTLAQRFETDWIWIAPEILSGRKQDTRSDMYAFGILLSQLETHEEPYQNLTNSIHRHGIEKCSDLELLNFISSGTFKVTFSPDEDDDLTLLGIQCVSQNPDERPTAQEALQVFKTAMEESHGHTNRK